MVNSSKPTDGAVIFAADLQSTIQGILNGMNLDTVLGEIKGPHLSPPYSEPHRMTLLQAPIS